ncbi:MAG: lipocalin-like domain-containing protein [Planctomycetes bacterium]|nr:lipocalin-like domain-containing protein [Planctomycetota bacterium]
MRIVPTGIVIALLTGCSTGSGNRDAEYTRKLVGVWEETQGLPGSGKVTGRLTYAADGRFTATVTYSDFDKARAARTYKANGTWKVKDGNFIYRVENSDDPLFMVAGRSGVDRIISVSESDFVYESGDSKARYSAKRIK